MNRVVNSKRIASDAPSGVMPPLRLRPEDCPAPNESASFTPKQGQYLAFIYAYTRVLRRPPAEADIQRYFMVTPPTVHQMLITLERSRVASGTAVTRGERVPCIPDKNLLCRLNHVSNTLRKRINSDCVAATSPTETN